MRRILAQQSLSFAERCKDAARAKLDAAAKLAPGPERAELERVAKELENARSMEGWLKTSNAEWPT